MHISAAIDARAKLYPIYYSIAVVSRVETDVLLTSCANTPHQSAAAYIFLVVALFGGGTVHCSKVRASET